MPITTSSHRTGRDLAERILDQALAFLVACSFNLGVPLAPGELVDIDRHTSSSTPTSTPPSATSEVHPTR